MSNFDAAIDTFDGNNPAPLKPLIEQLNLDIISELIEIELSSNLHQIATTWLIKAWTDEGNELSSAQQARLIQQLQDVDEWGAILHTYQMLEGHDISSTDAELLLVSARHHVDHQKTLVRAWALFASAQAAQKLPEHRSEVQQLLEKALLTEKGAVAVRVRKGLELLNL